MVPPKEKELADSGQKKRTQVMQQGDGEHDDWGILLQCATAQFPTPSPSSAAKDSVRECCCVFVSAQTSNIILNTNHVTVVSMLQRAPLVAAGTTQGGSRVARRRSRIIVFHRRRRSCGLLLRRPAPLAAVSMIS